MERATVGARWRECRSVPDLFRPAWFVPGQDAIGRRGRRKYQSGSDDRTGPHPRSAASRERWNPIPRDPDDWSA